MVDGGNTSLLYYNDLKGDKDVGVPHFLAWYSQKGGTYITFLRISHEMTRGSTTSLFFNN